MLLSFSGVISWACPIKSRGIFFSNVKELFIKLFDCPRNLWDIMNCFTGQGCGYMQAAPFLFGFWLVGCFLGFMTLDVIFAHQNSREWPQPISLVT